MMTPSSNGGHPHGTPDNSRKAYDSRQEQDTMIGSLGNALAGINLGNGYESSYQKDNVNSSGSGGVDWGSSTLPSNMHAFSGSNGNTTNANSMNNGQRVPSRQNLLFGTDMKDLHEPSSPVRKESLEMFLSQSPSQTLGQEVLQLQNALHDKTSNTAQKLNGWNDIRSTGSNIGAPSPNSRQDDQAHGRQKAESPTTSVSSRSVSPFNKGERTPSTIQAFHDTSRIPGVGSNTHLNNMPVPSVQSHVLPDVHAMQHMQNNILQMNQVQQYMAQAQPQQQTAAPQVLYMAVPTPDGRGQMLQPVQMLQIPGGAQTFVLPANTHMPSADTVQPMMVLPAALQQQPQSSPMDPNKGAQWPVPSQYSRNADHISNDYGVDRSTGDDYMNNIQRNINSPNNRNSPSMSANGADAIASLYSAPQRPPLDALLGHVRRLSRDQVGCRLLQQALDEEGQTAATLILNEGISFWGEAMVDPFGNYLFQKILEKITAKERIMLIKSVSARLVNASLNLHGTRSVQKVVELCAQDEAQSPEIKDPSDGSAADILTNALSPAAARLCIDSHGNHVIQRILLKLGHQHSRFVFDAVAASVGDVARHRHGCCVIQRCLDSPPSDARSHLVRRIVEKCLELMQDAYGNYVVQYVLDVCGDEDVHAVCESVVGKVCLLAIQKFSSNVMEKCLERCTDRVKELYLQELSDPEQIRELMMDPFGNYVVQRALSVATHAQAIRLVESMRPHLISSQPGTPHGQRNGGMRNTAGGRRIMAKICRRFPNFTLTAMGSPEELYSQHKGHHRRNQQGNMSYQSMSPTHQVPPPPPYGSPHQGQHVAPGNMRQPYFDVTGYYDPPTGRNANYHPHM
mmetsp:Transcript_27177/g.31019  ORF Transcript_27177/g.31019 Transcript_27177/m.31019 type:complete len:852 (+) Transcript_27177:205-2760(+)